MKKHGTLIVFGTALVLYAFFQAIRTNSDEHCRMAYALLHGHFYIDGLNVWEHVHIGGHDYSLHPPLSVLACLPFVLLFGLYTNQTAISAVVGAFAVACCWRFLQAANFKADRKEDEQYRRYHNRDDYRANAGDVGRVKIDGTSHSLWLTVFFGLGTVFAYEATLGASWGFCLTLSCVPTFLALTEVFGKRRPLIVGLWAGLAALARYDLALVWPIYALLLGKDWRRMGWPLLATCVAYFAFNYVRFGTIADNSLAQWFAVDKAGAIKHWPYGPFSLAYLPLNLYTAVFMAPNFSGEFPWIRPHAMGQSLLLTSPAFLLTLRPSLATRETLLLWAAVILGMSGALLVWSNGIEQFGARYWIQVYPFLIALMAKAPLDQMAKVLIVISIVFCLYGGAAVRIYGWPT